MVVKRVGGSDEGGKQSKLRDHKVVIVSQVVVAMLGLKHIV